MTGSLVVKPQSDTVACNPLEGRHLDARLLARFMSETPWNGGSVRHGLYAQYG